MSAKPRNIYEAKQTFVGLTPDGRAATIDVETLQDIDLSLHLTREALETLRSQIERATAALARHAQPQ